MSGHSDSDEESDYHSDLAKYLVPNDDIDENTSSGCEDSKRPQLKNTTVLPKYLFGPSSDEDCDPNEIPMKRSQLNQLNVFKYDKSEPENAKKTVTAPMRRSKRERKQPHWHAQYNTDDKDLASQPGRSSKRIKKRK